MKFLGKGSFSLCEFKMCEINLLSDAIDRW
jgi:hypothetical protein